MSDEPKSSAITRMIDVQKKQARVAISDLMRMRGLTPLLMKHRNGSAWSAEEKAELLEQMRTLSRLSPYLLFLFLPGSALLLPAYAWWLDRRRKPRATEDDSPAPPATPCA